MVTKGNKSLPGTSERSTPHPGLDFGVHSQVPGRDFSESLSSQDAGTHTSQTPLSLPSSEEFEAGLEPTLPAGQRKWSQELVWHQVSPAGTRGWTRRPAA